jgi:hypothetical protein
MIIKINTHKIRHQSNVKMLVGNYDNFRESKLKANYKDQFKINWILKDNIDKIKNLEKLKYEIWKEKKRKEKKSTWLCYHTQHNKLILKSPKSTLYDLIDFVNIEVIWMSDKNMLRF